MAPRSTAPQRARSVALGLLALLALVLVVRLTTGLPAIIFFGLVGGLLFSLAIIGLDLLHSAARKLDADDSHRPDDEGRR